MLSGISAITIGQSHIDNKTECQDSAILDFNDKYVMGAVADGHGSKKHFRSAKGSQFAVEAAKYSIYEYMNDNYEKFVDAYNKDKKYLIDRIIKMLITKWYEKIQEDINNEPITQEEIDKYLDGNFNEDKIASIYGTTLLVGVMGEGCNFGFLIGDGSFVVIDKHGKAYIPIEDENSKANYTTSLSSSDSFNGFVTHFFDEMPFSIMVSTDGLVKSFGDDNDFLDYNQAIAMELDGLDTVDKRIEMEDRLTKLFEQRSRDGSEDDISISIIFNSDAYESVKVYLNEEEKTAFVDTIGLLGSLSDKIKDVNKKMSGFISGSAEHDLHDLYRLIHKNFIRLNWNDEMIAPHERYISNIESLKIASDLMDKKKYEEAAKVLSEVDFNYYAEFFSERTYTFFEEQVTKRAKPSWGAGLVDNGNENLYKVIRALLKGVCTDAETEAVREAERRQRKYLKDAILAELNVLKVVKKDAGSLLGKL